MATENTATVLRGVITGERFLFIYLINFLLMFYKAGRPALKVCGLPAPTARKCTGIHTLDCTVIHILVIK